LNPGKPDRTIYVYGCRKNSSAIRAFLESLTHSQAWLYARNHIKMYK